MAAWITGVNRNLLFCDGRNEFKLDGMQHDMSSVIVDSDSPLRRDHDPTTGRFAKLLRMPSAPAHVIVDNYHHDAFPELLEPQPSPFVSHVTVISRDPPPETFASEVDRIEVGDLTTDQAAELVGAYLPDTPLADRDRLATALSHRALRVDYASQIIQKYGDTIPNYLRQISSPERFARHVINSVERYHDYTYEQLAIQPSRTALYTTHRI
ncbi:hypothetical protein [Nocardia arthritidis]|uniref:hypothetical protein n=1 Tax=Nocardia arthritidis TaxID=228602 RepID=UPI0012ED2E44|nr:hypothetical protein [Nocardia arthritidis]